ncbi:MAG TPA: Gfo/Idh/MocA family oxidoreductase [Tepidisphaeraceae bacterium]|nr:Gfo/Idh/MocA family oxidoreductase [Tepidisphaeraceae bacterium]
METRTIGIILNGVTGRMGTNQHLVRSILAIIRQGGIKVSDDLRLMPDPILTGRNPEKLRSLSETHGPPTIGKPLRWTTDLNAPLADKQYQVFFDASGTLQRGPFVEMAVKAGKAIYCEKPAAVEATEALRLARLCERAGLKNGVVQDKLWLPGMRKIRMLRQQEFFGKILSVRGEFGYWVFSGQIEDQPAQRPSWNYRKEDGGGIIVDMFCHWRYVIDNLFGPIQSLVACGSTDVPERIAEDGKPYKATADDSAYAIFRLKDGTLCQFNSSWCTRVRRDDLLTIQVDGTRGSCVAGLREAWVQSLSETPKPVWNPDIPQPINFFEGWQKLPNATEYENAFKIQWELFLRHVALDEPFPWTLREGAKGVQLAELGLQSWRERRWLDVPELEGA